MMSGNQLSARWKVTSRTPRWVTVQFRDSTHTVSPGPIINGHYIAEIDASIVRNVTPRSSALHLTVSNEVTKGGGETRFESPQGDWIERVFTHVADDRLYDSGRVTLMRIGEETVDLIASSEPPAISDRVVITVQDVYLAPEGDSVYLGVDYAETVQGNAELYFKTEGLPEPTVSKQTTIVSDRPVPSVRRVWRIPMSVDAAARKELEDQIETQYVGKPIPVPRGQMWQFFQVPLPDGKIGRVVMGVREQGMVEPE
jgi:hypothetical protein